MIGANTACSRLAERPALAPEAALAPAERGALERHARRVDAELAAGDSAYWLLDRSRLAFESRLALVDGASVSLDVQYFIWQEDATGHLLASRLLAAADRGVRIRVLLDDFSVSSQSGEVMHLDAHPSIDVRVFNPWASRGLRIVKGLEFLSRPRELNRRMHNKALVADNRFAIVGGRNIGDRYFGLFEGFVQNDLDVLVAGPLVADVSASFDAYWNDARAYPVGVLHGTRNGVRELAATRSLLDKAVADHAEVLAVFRAGGGAGRFLEGLPEWQASGPGKLLYDSPLILDPCQKRLYPDFKRLVASAEREVLLSSPYFIPDRGFVELIRSLTARGVRVAIVTNSLESNNHALAHTAYKQLRRKVLGAGAELYELRADAAALADYRTPPVLPAALGLHGKAVVVDGTRAFVGSPNVDPRSMVLNTEIGVVADSAALAGRLRELLVRDMAPENAWRVTMDGDGWLTWSNGARSVKRQPARHFRQRLEEFFLNLLPLKKQG